MPFATGEVPVPGEPTEAAGTVTRVHAGQDDGNELNSDGGGSE